MCRFLLVRSKTKIKSRKLLEDFASMCQKSRAPDGDWQGDGYGIAWQQKDNHWEMKKSLQPIWQEQSEFQYIPQTHLFAAHARSAGFPDQKGIIEFNQPYIFPDVMLNSFQHPRHDSKKILNQVQDDRITSSNSLVYVFNGMIRGVRLSMPLEGKIGAQKIFSLILEEKKGKSFEEVLKSVAKLLLEKSEKIIGMNIGVVKENKFYMLCEYSENENYFGLRYFQDQELTIICSQPIGSYAFKVMNKGEILVL